VFFVNTTGLSITKTDFAVNTPFGKLCFRRTVL